MKGFLRKSSILLTFVGVILFFFGGNVLAGGFLDVARKTLGADRVADIDPVMGGEGFAYFLEKVPGTFLFLGAGDRIDFPHHHPAFDIDEKVLPLGTLLMTSLALEYLLT